MAMIKIEPIKYETELCVKLSYSEAGMLFGALGAMIDILEKSGRQDTAKELYALDSRLRGGWTSI